MTSLKLRRAFALANVAPGPVTERAIIADIEAAAPAELLASLSSRQLAAVLAIAHSSYHKGRQVAGANVVDGDAVWIDAVGRLLPLAALRAIQIEESEERVDRKPTHIDSRPYRIDRSKRYTLNFTERF